MGVREACEGRTHVGGQAGGTQDPKLGPDKTHPEPLGDPPTTWAPSLRILLGPQIRGKDAGGGIAPPPCSPTGLWVLSSRAGRQQSPCCPSLPTSTGEPRWEDKCISSPRTCILWGKS